MTLDRISLTGSLAGYEIDEAATHEYLQMETFLLHMAGLWWGWGYQDIVDYYSRQHRPVMLARKLSPGEVRIRSGLARPPAQHRRSSMGRRP